MPPCRRSSRCAWLTSRQRWPSHDAAPSPAHRPGWACGAPQGASGARLRALLGGGRATEQTWEEVEEALIAADFGPEATLELVDAARAVAGRGRSGDDARQALAKVVRERLQRTASGQFELGPAPAVILVVGVNGTGKTTTIAKLAGASSATAAA